MKIKFQPNKTGWIIILSMIGIAVAIAIRKRKTIKQFAVKSINYLKEKSWDLVSDKRISKLHPLVREKAKEFIIRAEKELGKKLRVVSGLRTWDEQARLYAQGRTLPGKIVTNAKPGQSLHNYGLAIDVVEIKDGKALWNNPDWEKIARLGKSIGFEWGGDWKSFKDKPHFEMRFGKSLAQLQQLYQSGKRNGEYVYLT
jgi:peptidoglycan L-alanyl-D-glutamate endopeptidase CwlK|tara:strand:- start:201 stop:797 length:597 start_codon:yes stop_codon:yes gene_type:complete